MWALNSEIKIKNYTFNQVVNCVIDRSSRLIGDVATIELPLSAIFENKKKLTIENQINRGDEVEIKLGYDGELITEFTGFVKEVSASKKTIITCEDKIYLLRKPLENKSFKNASLKDVIKYIAGSLKLNDDIPEVNFNSFILKNVTGLQALQKIKDQYGLTVFIDYDGKLFVGLAYTYSTGSVVYDLHENIVKSNLAFKRAEDIKYKIKAISIQKNNKRLEVITGDTDGDQRTLYFRNIENKTELEKLANEEIQKYKYTGYRGKLNAFGLPLAKFGMKANIKDENYPAREGDYYVDSVKTSFGQNGFRRIVELGVQL